MPVEVSKQFDVAMLVNVPVVLMLTWVLRRDEHQIGVKPCRATIPIRKWMDAHSFGMGDNAEFA